MFKCTSMHTLDLLIFVGVMFFFKSVRKHLSKTVKTSIAKSVRHKRISISLDYKCCIQMICWR